MNSSRIKLESLTLVTSESFINDHNTTKQTYGESDKICAICNNSLLCAPKALSENNKSRIPTLSLGMCKHVYHKDCCENMKTCELCIKANSASIEWNVKNMISIIDT